MAIDFSAIVAGHATTHPDAIVAAANAAIAEASVHGESVTDDDMLAFSVLLAKENIAQGNGGPFGAVLVNWQGDLPHIVGIGANHVTQRNDPSAHAEVEAVRDAAARQGYSDLSGAVLYSSCECCPMCLSVAAGSGVARIAYVATRQQAAQAGFSDELQYKLCELPDDTLMTHIADDARDEMLSKLEDHGAVLMDSAGRVLSFGDGDTQRDPSALASVEAVRGAVSLTGQLWLPEGCTLLSYHMPHLAGVMVADWARLLRPRSQSNPGHPEQDAAMPNPLRICYIIDAPEQVILRDAHGQDSVAHDAVATRQLPCESEAVRRPPAQRAQSHALRQQAQAVFDAWIKGIEGGTQMRY